MVKRKHDTIPQDKMIEAIEAIEEGWNNALEAYVEFRDNDPIKTIGAKERLSYLHGVLHGWHQALREFEKRTPIEWTEN